jgi:L-ascorbate metabolism protein UlaG (beta-lactamase superfamily)
MFMFEAGGAGVLVDPVLGGAGTAEPAANTPNQRRNPLVDLSLSDEESTTLLQEINVVLVTHNHADHWDPRAEDLVPKDAPILCQPEDEEKIEATGFQQVAPIDGGLEWGSLRLMRTDLRLMRTDVRHGTGEIGRRMAPLSDFVVRSEGSPTLYVAEDTIWCPEVEQVLAVHRPDVVVVNAGAAQCLEGAPRTMTAEVVTPAAGAALVARRIAVHMETIDHCLLIRQELKDASEREGDLRAGRDPRRRRDARSTLNTPREERCWKERKSCSPTPADWIPRSALSGWSSRGRRPTRCTWTSGKGSPPGR